MPALKIRASDMPPCPYCASTLATKDGFDPLTRQQRYKCKQCGRKFAEHSTGRAKPVRRITRLIHCLNCGSETTNPKFCSVSCAATYTNRTIPKRQAKPRFCKHCGEPLTAQGRVTCEACNPNVVNWMERTLGELHHVAKYQVNAHLRTLARNLYQKADLPRACANCGYDKHVEICHIQPINSFPDETPVAVINALHNLVALCPNCHWEFDHGVLALSPA